MVTPTQTITQQKKIIANLTASRNSLQTQLTAEKAKVTSMAFQITTLQQQVAALQQQLNSANAKVTALTAENAALKTQLADVQQQLDVAQQEIATLKARIVALEAEVAALKAQLPAEPPPVEEPPPPPPPPPPPTDAGWTVFTASADTRKVYVSNSAGLDTNDGLSEAKPVKTLAKGKSLLRHGFPDWLLLKKGDVWTNEIIGVLTVSGRSATEPMLISAYGTGAWPLLKCNVGDVIMTMGGGGGLGKGDYFAVVGLEFYGHIWDPASPTYNASAPLGRTAITMLNPSNWVLVEGNKFSFFSGAIVAQSSMHKDIRVRRNVIVDQYAKPESNHSSGLYFNDFNNLLIEENLLDHNGWNESIATATQTVFNHNIYAQGFNNHGAFNGPVVIRGNIFARDASGSQFRSGGTVEDNLFVSNPYPHNIGMPTTFASKISGNVYLEGVNAAHGNYGWGPNTFSEYQGRPYNVGAVAITNNIIAHSTVTGGFGINFDAGSKGNSATGNIIYKWPNPIVNNGTNNVTSPNDINLTTYVDPNRSVGSYNASLGGVGTTAAFLAEARKQSRDNWRPQYTAAAVNSYIRAGFAAS